MSNRKVYCCEKCFPEFVKPLDAYNAYFSEADCECTREYDDITGRHIMIRRLKCEVCRRRTCCSSQMWEIQVGKSIVLI